jgi:hypothetical protein
VEQYPQYQIHYRGDLSQTVSGIECQAWASQEPHFHLNGPAIYPNDGLVENFCRNPVGIASSESLVPIQQFGRLLGVLRGSGRLQL